jgi:hypothetical protein
MEFPSFRNDAMVGDTVSVDYGALTIRATIVPDNDTSPTDFDCYTEKQIEAYNRGEWRFVGVVVSIHLDDITLDDHAASLWGCDCGDGAGGYLSDTANDLLHEAMPTADRLLATLRHKLAAA